MSPFVAALMRVTGSDVTVQLHPALLEPVLGDAAPCDVLTATWTRDAGELNQQSEGGPS